MLCSWLGEVQQIGEKYSRMEELVNGGAVHGIFALILSHPQEWARDKAAQAALGTLMHHLLPNSASSIMYRLEQIVNLQPVNSSAVASFLVLTIRAAVCGNGGKLPSDPIAVCGSGISQVFAEREQLVERLLLLRFGRQQAFDSEGLLEKAWQEVSRSNASVQRHEQCDQLEYRLTDLRTHHARLCDELRLCEENINSIVRELDTLRQRQALQQTMDCSLVDGLSESPVLVALRAFQKDVLIVPKRNDEAVASKEEVELVFSDYLTKEVVCVDFLVDRISKTREAIAQHEKELSIYQSLSMKRLVEECRSAVERMRRELSEDEQAVQDILDFLASCFAPSPNGNPNDGMLSVVSHESGFLELSPDVVKRLQHLMASLDAISSVTAPPALLRFRPPKRSTSFTCESIRTGSEVIATTNSPTAPPAAAIVVEEGKNGQNTAQQPSRRPASKRNGQQRKVPYQQKVAQEVSRGKVTTSRQAVDTGLAIKALEKSTGWKANVKAGIAGKEPSK